MKDKRERYQELVLDRKGCGECSDLVKPSSFPVLDSDHLGPWSRWQGKLDADIVVVGQDWGTVSYFRENAGIDEPGSNTNEPLRELLSEIGYEIPAFTPACNGSGPIFLTNAILCLKAGDMQSKVRDTWWRSCSRRFLRRTLDLIQPRVVVALGQVPFRAIAASYGVKIPSQLGVAVDNPTGYALGNEVRCFPVFHCSRGRRHLNRSFEQQRADWQRIARFLVEVRTATAEKV